MTYQRVAVVTGAAGGLGRAFVDRLLADGLTVVGVDIDGAALLAMAADREGFVAEAVDLTDAEAIADLFDRLVARFGGVDALVNNAGTCFMSDFPDIPAAELDRQMAVNFSSCFHCCQGAVKAMAGRPGVRKIVNISSNGAYNFDVFDPPHYRASKAAMDTLTKDLARRYAREKIAVNSIAPAMTETPLFNVLTEEVLARAISAMPHGRAMQPEEIAAWVGFLISPAGDVSSGNVIILNQGATCGEGDQISSKKFAKVFENFCAPGGPMKVTIHKLFDYLLETTAQDPPECFIGFSLARSPRLKDFLSDLDPELSLDWNGNSFLGLPALRQRVLDQAGLSLPLDSVLITAGAAEANYLLFRQLLTAGDEIITEAPGWPQAGVMAKAIGATLVEVERDEADGWHLDPQAVARAITPRTRMIFLTNPNNPTGRLIPEADLRALADLAERHGIWLVVDEVYAGLEWVGSRPPAIAGMTRFGITTGSVSKALGLQGLRTGWMICQSPEVIRDAMIARENGSEIMNVLGEHIAEVALRPERLAAALAVARAEGAETLDLLHQFVGNEPRLSWHRPQAGLIGLARVTGTDGESLARALLGPPYRTFLLPGSAYGLPHHIRIGAGGGPEARLNEGLGRLSALLGSGST